MTDLAGHNRTFFFNGAGVAADLNAPYTNSGAAALLTLDELNAGGVVTEAAGAIVEGPGVISLELAAVGQFIFSGANAFSGGVLIAGSTRVSVGASGALGTGAITFLTSGAAPALESLATNFATAQAIAIDAGVSATLAAAAGDALTVLGAFNDAGGQGTTLHIGSATDTGTVVLNTSAATEDTTGALSVDGGTLRLGSAASAQMISALLGGVAVKGTLDLGGQNLTANNLSGAGRIVNSGAAATLKVVGAASAVLSASISGPIALELALGAFSLTGANSYTGGTTIDAGAELDVGVGSPPGAIAGNVVDNGLLNFNLQGLVNFTGALSGSGSLAQTRGNLKLTGDTSQFSGQVSLRGGATTLVAANAFNKIAGLSLFYGQWFRAIANVTLAAPLFVGQYNSYDSVTLSAAANKTLTFAGVFSTPSFSNVVLHIGRATDTGVVILTNGSGAGFDSGVSFAIDGGTLVAPTGLYIPSVVFTGTTGKLIVSDSNLQFVSSGAGSTGEVDLNSSQVTFFGGGETVKFLSGSNNTATLYNTGSLWDTVYGSGGLVTLGGARASIVGGGDVVNFYGSAPSIASLFNTAGNADSVHGVGVVNLTNAQASVFNGGVTVNLLGAAPDSVSFYNANNVWDTVYGSNGTISLTAACASIVGGGDTVNLLGGGDMASLYNTNNASDTVNGSFGLVILTSAQASIVGGGDTINFDGAASDSVSLSGTNFNGDTVNAVNGSITLNSAQAAIIGYNDTIHMNGASVAIETLTSSAGHDTYVYQQASGDSAIGGFTTNDAMQLSQAVFANVQDLFNHMTQSGSDTIISLDAFDQITLFNVQKSSLSQSQFSLT